MTNVVTERALGIQLRERKDKPPGVS